MTNPKTEAEALEMLKKSLDLYRGLPSKAEFVEKYLKPLLVNTELDIQDCKLSSDGKRVLLAYSSGAMRWIKVEGDNRFALCVDVIKELDGCRA